MPPNRQVSYVTRYVNQSSVNSKKQMNIPYIYL